MLKPHTFTVDDFTVMVDAGLFHDQRVELLDGVIVDTSPASPGHECAIDVIAENLTRAFIDRARTRVQNAVDIELPEWLPHPDITLLKRKDYSEARPTPRDIFVLIEVTNTSLELDLGHKREIYARVGVEDYWVADLNGETWFIHREPEGEGYDTILELPFGEAFAPLTLPDVTHVWL